MDENKEDKPLSSEELLRRAREGLGEGSTTEPPSDFRIESYPPPVTEPELDTTDLPIVDEPVEYEAPTYDPPTYEPPPAPPASEPTSWAPPPLDGDDDTPWAAPPAPTPTPVPSRGRGAGNTIWVLVVIFVVGMGVFSLLDSSTNVEEIQIGDCFDMPEQEEFNKVDTVDCNEPHDVEVYAMPDISRASADFAIGAAHPGDMALYDAALEECLTEFEGYVGAAWADSVLYIDAFYPTIEGWREFDDREIQCVLVQLDEELLNIVKSSRSFRNSGL